MMIAPLAGDRGWISPGLKANDWSRNNNRMHNHLTVLGVDDKI